MTGRNSKGARGGLPTSWAGSHQLLLPRGGLPYRQVPIATGSVEKRSGQSRRSQIFDRTRSAHSRCPGHDRSRPEGDRGAGRSRVAPPPPRRIGPDRERHDRGAIARATLGRAAPAGAFGYGSAGSRQFRPAGSVEFRSGGWTSVRFEDEKRGAAKGPKSGARGALGRSALDPG
jgi:hypothetical protein